jgi:hypothetical protein
MLQERIVLLDNFNVWMAPRLFQGADAAIMLADDGREASATGFMKAQLNGGLMIATDDGAIPESVIFQGYEKTGPDLPAGRQAANGFEVPYFHGHPRADGLMRAFKQLHQILLDPALHAAMVRSALTAETQVTIRRTLQETLAFYNRILAVPAGAPVAK